VSFSAGLEEQLIIRFPPDVAARLDSSLDSPDFADFDITFVDSTHATVTLFGETLSAVLLPLPTSVETYRTPDACHLHKSGDIDHILIVHRADAVPPECCEHGLTPPTTDIVAKRQARLEALRVRGSFDDVEYWQLVELQLSALAGKMPRAPVRKTEALEEPALDPALLEKILRRRGHREFAGYSGTEIAESELEGRDAGAPEPAAPPGGEAAEDEEEGDEPQPAAGREEEEEEEGEEDKDELARLARGCDLEIARLELELRALPNTEAAANPYLKDKLQAREDGKRRRIEDLKRRLSGIRDKE
jgi:transcription initiation factor TFIID subunit 7